MKSLSTAKRGLQLEGACANLELDAGAGLAVGAGRVEFLDDFGLEGFGGHIVGGRGGGHCGQQHHDGARAQSHCVLLRLSAAGAYLYGARGTPKFTAAKSDWEEKNWLVRAGEAVRPVGIKARDGCRLSYT